MYLLFGLERNHLCLSLGVFWYDDHSKIFVRPYVSVIHSGPTRADSLRLE